MATIRHGSGATCHISNVEPAGAEDDPIGVTTTVRDSMEKANAVTGSGGQRHTSKAIQKTALDYVKTLRAQDPHFERPLVVLMEKEAGQFQPIEDIKKAGREELRKARQTANAVNEGSGVSTKPAPQQAKAQGSNLHTGESDASSTASLPPRDSPLTTVFLGQYLSLLVQETITSRKSRYSDLARGMSMSEIVLQEAVQGKLPLTRGRWVRFVQLLGLSTMFEVRGSERNGMPCWELCYPPIRVGQPMQW